jgi:hypothetical protein
MRKVVASLAALLLVSALPGSSAASSKPTLLGIGWASGGGTRLTRFDPLTLRRVSEGLRLNVVGWPWRRSPDRARIALSSDGPDASLVVVDAARLRREAHVELGIANPVAIAWPDADRILVVGLNRDVSEAQIAVLDPGSGQVLGRTRLFGQLVAGDATADGLALLFGPRVGIGRARLVLVDKDLHVRSLALPETQAGWARAGAHAQPGDPRARVRAPGLAVDRAGRRAWVTAHDQSLAEIDLRSGAVSYRAVRVRRLAVAAKSLLGSTATALWLGHGRLAVTGLSYEGQSYRGLGLSILDVRTGVARVVDEYAEWVQRSGNLLVTWTEIEGVGVFDLQGRAKPRVLSGLNVAYFVPAGRRGFVEPGAGRPSLIVDLPSGRVIGRARSPKHGPLTFLLGDGSPISP